MGKEEDKIEERIDSLIDELKKEELGRKRDKVFSKIDLSYNILTALSVFLAGLIVTQRQNFTGSVSVGILFTMVGAILSMLYSYYIGFKGMVNDSIEDRIRSWCLLLVSVAWYLVTPWVFEANALIGKNTLLYDGTEIGFAFVLVFIAVLVSLKFTKWSVNKLEHLLDQKIEVPKMLDYTLERAFLILIFTFLVSIVIALIIG